MSCKTMQLISFSHGGKPYPFFFWGSNRKFVIYMFYVAHLCISILFYLEAKSVQIFQ